MSKAANIAKISTHAGFHYLWGLVISTVISSIGTIYIASLLGSEQYGLYTIALTVPTLIAFFRDWGINFAMIKFTAQYRAENRASEIRSLFLSGLIFELVLGVALSIVSFVLSDLIAINAYNRPFLTPLIQVASLSILTTALVTVATAAFTGVEKMHLNSVMLIAQSIIRTIVVVALVYVGFGTGGAVIGFTASTLIAGLIGVFLMFTVYWKLPAPATLKLEKLEFTKEMLKYGLPLSLSTIIGGFLTQFYSFILPWFVADDTLIGNYGVATTFVVLITFFATPATTMLFPAFSKLDPLRDKQTLKDVFQASIKYASLLVVPVALLVMALSEPAISTLFASEYPFAPLFLSLSAIAYLYTALGNLSVNNLINSQGYTGFLLKLTVLTAAIGFPLGTVMIYCFGVLGLIITTLTAGLPSFFISIFWVKKQFGLSVDWGSSGKIVFASGLTAVLTYFLVGQLAFASWLRLLVGCVFFVVVLVPLLLFSGAVTRVDLANLRVMVGGLGVLGGLLGRVLGLFERLMSAFRL